jgi:hypothetical protein
MVGTRSLFVIGFGILTVTLSSCSKPSSSTTPSGKASGKGTTEEVKSSGGAAAGIVKAFLKSVEAGQVDPNKLTVDFKKIIGPPVSGSDKDKGFSDWSAGEWFKPLSKQLPTGEPQEVELASGVVAVLVPGSSTTGPAVFRLTKSGSEWLIDWFHIGPKNASAKLDSKDKPAEFVALQLMQTAIANQLDLSETLLTQSFKARIAPPLPGDVGYNKSILKSKLGQLRSNAVSYTFTKVNIGADSGMIDGTVTLDTAGKPGDSRPISIKVVKGTKPGEWLVDDFEPR